MRHLESPAWAFTCSLAAHTGLVPKTDEVVFVDIDSKVKQVYGPAKQGACGLLGLSSLAAFSRWLHGRFDTSPSSWRNHQAPSELSSTPMRGGPTVPW